MALIRNIALALCLWGPLLSPAHAAPKPVSVWSYYEVAPYKTHEDNSGLAMDLVNLLNLQAQGQFHFSLSIIPRSRLNYYLKNQHQGIVLFVNPVWMGKNSEHDYLWSNLLLEDQNEIISSVHNPIEYTGPDSLKDHSFASIRGRFYLGLEKLLDSGEITRKVANNGGSALLLVSSGRIDATSMARSLLMTRIIKHQLQGKLYLSKIPLLRFTRYIMTSKELPKVHKFLQSVTHDMSKNKPWQIILNKYGLSNEPSK